jgi:uncharacterized membrane protein YphA (DoxX/SURF4 family)
MKRIKVIVIWLIGISFMIIGLLKYINLDEPSKSVFDRANYPQWFFYVVATIEFAGGALLLMTAETSKRLGSILIGIIMMGAIGTHFILRDHYTYFILPGIVLLMAILVSLDYGKKEKRTSSGNPEE